MNPVINRYKTYKLAVVQQCVCGYFFGLLLSPDFSRLLQISCTLQLLPAAHACVALLNLCKTYYYTEENLFYTVLLATTILHSQFETNERTCEKSLVVSSSDMAKTCLNFVLTPSELD